MVSLISLQAFFALAILVTVGLYLVHRRTDMESALLGAIGATILGLYLMVGIVVSVVDVV